MNKFKTKTAKHKGDLDSLVEFINKQGERGWEFKWMDTIQERIDGGNLTSFKRIYFQKTYEGTD